MENTVFITTEEAIEVQKADAKVRAMQQVFLNFLDEHLLSKNTDFMKSAVYLKYQEMLIEAEVEAENLKNAVLDKYVDRKNKKVSEFFVNYATNELIYTVE